VEAIGVRLVYMGTSAFAVPTLRALFEAGYSIAGVVTQPDKPGGRGHSLQASPVKQEAARLHLSVYQPATLKDDAARALFEALQPDMLVVAAYGKLVPPWLIALPRYGVLNLHGSLLPKYRGAAPIQRAVANGERETGVCTMRIDEGLDTGPVYLCEKTPIGSDETSEDVSIRLATLGSRLMIRTVEGVVTGTLQPAPQDPTQATYAPPLKKEEGRIDWTWPAPIVHNKVRGFRPWPGTVTKFRDAVCKILQSKVGQATPSAAAPGTILATKPSLAVVCGDGTLLEVVEIQAPGRKPLAGVDFANGMRIRAGEKFEPVVDNDQG